MVVGAAVVVVAAVVEPFAFPPAAVVEGAIVVEVAAIVVLGAAVVVGPVVDGAMVVVVSGTGRPHQEKFALGLHGAEHCSPPICAYSHMVLHMLVWPSQKQPFMSWKKGPMQSSLVVASEQVGRQSCAATPERQVQPELVAAHLVWLWLCSAQRT